VSHGTDGDLKLKWIAGLRYLTIFYPRDFVKLQACYTTSAQNVLSVVQFAVQEIHLILSFGCYISLSTVLSVADKRKT